VPTWRADPWAARYRKEGSGHGTALSHRHEWLAVQSTMCCGSSLGGTGASQMRQKELTGLRSKERECLGAGPACVERELSQVVACEQGELVGGFIPGVFVWRKPSGW